MCSCEASTRHTPILYRIINVGPSSELLTFASWIALRGSSILGKRNDAAAGSTQLMPSTAFRDLVIVAACIRNPLRISPVS